MKSYLMFIALIIVLSGLSLSWGYKLISEEMELVSKEGECIAELISLGIERRDIVAANGTCHVSNR